MAQFIRYRGLRINVNAIGSYKAVDIELNDGSTLKSTVLNLTEVYESRRLKNKTTTRNYSYRIFAIGVTPDVIDKAIESGSAIIDITPNNIDELIGKMKKTQKAEQAADDVAEQETESAGAAE